MGAALIVTPCSVPRLTVTASPCSVTSAPNRRKTSSTPRSPCEDCKFSPSTVTPSFDSAPMQRKNAVFDQSPSTTVRFGR